MSAFPEHLRRCATCGQARIEHERGAAGTCLLFRPVDDDATLLRKNYAAARSVQLRLGAALDRQEELLDAFDRDPGNPELAKRCAEATEKVRGLIAEAQEWVSG